MSSFTYTPIEQQSTYFNNKDNNLSDSSIETVMYKKLLEESRNEKEQLNEQYTAKHIDKLHYEAEKTELERRLLQDAVLVSHEKESENSLLKWLTVVFFIVVAFFV